jgi:NAD(P)-dependent dehydrogenase (short-subunit alcohol dehydrogenase family)
VISGGSSGIGLALARQLAVVGQNLTILARDGGRLAAAESTLAAYGAKVLTRSVDVADAEAVEDAVRQAVETFGVPELVIACAGIVVPGRLEDQPLEAFHRTVAVNYLGALHLVRAALPAMRDHGGGRVVMVASGAALVGLYGYTSYAPSKFAVRGLAEALRSELVPEGVAVVGGVPARHRHAGVPRGGPAPARSDQPARGDGRPDDRGRGCGRDRPRDRARTVHHRARAVDGGAAPAAQPGRPAPASVLVRSPDPAPASPGLDFPGGRD